MLEARGVSFSYQGKAADEPLIKELSLEVAAGERVVVQAPSGFGKTTLCRLLAGYLNPLEGEIIVDGVKLPRKGRCPVQMIMQHPETAVDPRLRMRDTLAEAGEVSEELMQRFGVREEWLSRFPHELSGGELQRFCIVRALITLPSYLIADEISTMLDALTQAKIWNGLLQEAERQGFGMVIVTHSAALARRIATRTLDLTA